jgi:flagellar hook-basal body complex protein FliE
MQVKTGPHSKVGKFLHVSTMTDPASMINPLSGKFPMFDVPSLSEAVRDAPPGFADILAESIQSVDSLSDEADRMTVDLSLGKPVELHQVMLATTKAQIALELFIEIRNKIIEAYQEISRMPV